MSNSFIWPIDGTLLDATTSGPSGPGDWGNERVFYIPQISTSDCLMSYPEHSLGEWGGLTPLQRCSRYILQPTQLGLCVCVCVCMCVRVIEYVCI